MAASRLGHRVRRFDRRFEDGYAIDLDRFASLVSTRTRLAIVTNLHNPSGARIPLSTLQAMAALLARVEHDGRFRNADNELAAAALLARHAGLRFEIKARQAKKRQGAIVVSQYAGRRPAGG